MTIKADVPKLPFHPHCYCVISPTIALINPKPKFNPKAERAFLAGCRRMRRGM